MSQADGTAAIAKQWPSKRFGGKDWKTPFSKGVFHESRCEASKTLGKPFEERLSPVQRHIYFVRHSVVYCFARPKDGGDRGSRKRIRRTKYGTAPFREFPHG
jgi:hypothetical protein